MLPHAGFVGCFHLTDVHFAIIFFFFAPGRCHCAAFRDLNQGLQFEWPASFPYLDQRLCTGQMVTFCLKLGNVGFHVTLTVQQPKERCVWGWGQRSRSVGSRKANMVVASTTLRKIVNVTKTIAKILINICPARCTSGRKTLIPKKKSQKNIFFDILHCHAKNFDKT